MTPFFFSIIVLVAVSVPAASAVYYEDITATDIIDQISELNDDIQTAHSDDAVARTSDASALLVASSEYELIDEISGTNTLLVASSEYELIDEISGTNTLLVASSTGSITGIVYEDVNGNGVQDEGEPGIEGYRMLAIDYATLEVMEAYTAADGTYTFKNITPAPATTLVQTWYHPLGTTVDPTSWFRYVTPEAGQTITFDVGFYPVPPEDLVTLEILAYSDDNHNGVQDPGEQGIGSLDSFYAYTYTTGPVAYLVTDEAGMATVTDLVPTDFALLVFVDQLAESGYIWASTSYERNDGVTDYDSTLPVAVSPEPGSTHTMRLGLVLIQ